MLFAPELAYNRSISTAIIPAGDIQNICDGDLNTYGVIDGDGLAIGAWSLFELGLNAAGDISWPIWTDAYPAPIPNFTSITIEMLLRLDVNNDGVRIHITEIGGGNANANVLTSSSNPTLKTVSITLSTANYGTNFEDIANLRFNVHMDILSTAAWSRPLEVHSVHLRCHGGDVWPALCTDITDHTSEWSDLNNVKDTSSSYASCVDVNSGVLSPAATFSFLTFAELRNPAHSANTLRKVDHYFKTELATLADGDTSQWFTNSSDQYVIDTIRLGSVREFNIPEFDPDVLSETTIPSLSHGGEHVNPSLHTYDGLYWYQVETYAPPNLSKIITQVTAGIYGAYGSYVQFENLVPVSEILLQSLNGQSSLPTNSIIKGSVTNVVGIIQGLIQATNIQGAVDIDVLLSSLQISSYVNEVITDVSPIIINGEVLGISSVINGSTIQVYPVEVGLMVFFSEVGIPPVSSPPSNTTIFTEALQNSFIITNNETSVGQVVSSVKALLSSADAANSISESDRDSAWLSDLELFLRMNRIRVFNPVRMAEEDLIKERKVVDFIRPAVNMPISPKKNVTVIRKSTMVVFNEVKI